jgi:soluble P-type ATPase
MLNFTVPGRGTLNINALVLDYNGTIALDGILFPTIANYLCRLSKYIEIHVITADTFDSVRTQCAKLPVQVHVLETEDHTQEKANFVQGLGAEGVYAIGNGTNDQDMLRYARVGVLVLGPEGCSREALDKADILIRNIEDALELLENPKRLIATLRR